MKLAFPTALVSVTLGLAGCVDKETLVKQERERYFKELAALPAVPHDFTTAAGAILCLEDAYRRKDIEAAIAAKDFKTEARLMLQETGFKDPVYDKNPVYDATIAESARALELAFRSETTKSWPEFEGLQSFFPEGKTPYGDQSNHVFVITEVCRFSDGDFSRERILVVETANGWRVLNALD